MKRNKEPKIEYSPPPKRNIIPDGYKLGSPDFTNPYNLIKSNRITMKNVPFPVMGIGSDGTQQMMMPNGEYYFPNAKSVMEFPQRQAIAQFGGTFLPVDVTRKKLFDNANGSPSTESTIGIGPEDDGKYYTIPTVINGKRFSTNDAVDYFRKTGEHMGMYDTLEESEQGSYSREKANIGLGSTGLYRNGGSTGGWLDKYSHGGVTPTNPPIYTMDKNKIQMYNDSNFLFKEQNRLNAIPNALDYNKNMPLGDFHKKGKFTYMGDSTKGGGIMINDFSIMPNTPNSYTQNYKKPVQPYIYGKKPEPIIDTSNWKQSSLDSLTTYNDAVKDRKYELAPYSNVESGPNKGFIPHKATSQEIKEFEIMMSAGRKGEPYKVDMSDSRVEWFKTGTGGLKGMWKLPKKPVGVQKQLKQTQPIIIQEQVAQPVQKVVERPKVNPYKDMKFTPRNRPTMDYEHLLQVYPELVDEGLMQQFLKNPNGYKQGGSVKTNWLDKYQDGGEGSSTNPVQLDEVQISSKNKWQKAYEKANTREAFVNKKKQEYLKSSPQGLDKLYGVGMNNFPREVEQGFNAQYDRQRDTYASGHIIKDKGANPANRTEWVEKLKPHEKEIIKNSDYGFQLEPTSYASTLAGLAKATPFARQLLKKTPGLTEKEYKDASVMDAMDIYNIPGQMVYAGLESKYKNVPMFSGQHDPQRVEGAEDVLNPLNWAMAADLAGAVKSVPKIIKGIPKIIDNLTNAKALKKISSDVELIPTRTAKDVAHKFTNLKKDLGIDNSLLSAKSYLPKSWDWKAQAAIENSMRKKLTSFPMESKQSLYDANTTYHLGEKYGINWDNFYKGYLEEKTMLPHQIAEKTKNVSIIKNPELSERFGNTTYSILNKDKQIGHISGELDNNGDFITHDIEINPSHQKQGIGTKVYEQLNSSLNPGNKVKSFGAFIENNNIKPGQKVWENLVKNGKATKTNGKYEMIPSTKEVISSGDAFKNIPNDIQYQKNSMMSTDAPKGNMYGENQVLVQQSRLLNPEIKAKFFEHQAPYIEPDFSKKGLFESNFVKIPRDYGNRITPENYEDFIKNIHGSTEYGVSKSTGFKSGNLGVGNYGKPGMVFKDAPLNNLGKDIISAHEKNHGVFAGTLSSEMKQSLLSPFGTKKPIPHYGASQQGDEVLTRMGQFKNAIGIGDNQIFTLGHLNLIRKNYASSFLDNGITEMLKKLKPGSVGEKEFLKNMNKYAFGLAPAAVAGTVTANSDNKKTGGQTSGWLSKYE